MICLKLKRKGRDRNIKDQQIIVIRSLYQLFVVFFIQLLVLSKNWSFK